jgi:ATP-dependent Clp protease ATP-binding subunit ClpB/ATP-dependent Clp protease ATP-binding subunit ClpC
MKEKGTKLVFDVAVLEFIANASYSEKFGARNMRRFIEKHVEDKIATLVVDNDGKSFAGISLALSDGDISINAI